MEPEKKKHKRGSISFKQFVLGDKKLSAIYGFENEVDKIQWDYEKNKVLPEDVAKASHTQFWFWCPKCKHSCPKRLDAITNMKKSCGFCKGKVRCQSKECAHCYTTSFANAAKIKPQHAELLTKFNNQWSDENDLEPWMIAANDNRQYKFDCKECGHTIDQRLGDLMNGSGCGYCRSGSRLFCGDEHCQHCLKRSVAGNPMAQAIWDTKANRANGHEAHTTARCCNKKFVWICPTQDKDGTSHIFKMRADCVANGCGCAECKNKTEKKVKDYLRTQFSTTLLGAQLLDETSFEWCKNKQALPFDIIIVLADGTLIIIEVDGRQHYDKDSYYARKSKYNIKKRDRYKEKRALANGYSVIRLKQEDVWYDRTDWQTLLLSAISLCQCCEGNIVEKTY